MSTKERQLWILAGGNGAGKSTFYQTRLKGKGVEFINADIIERKHEFITADQPSYEAAKVARKMYREYIDMGRSFCFETVFSHVSKLELLVEAQKLNYYVNLVFIHLSNPALNVLRVKQRVSEGGHPVPVDKITTRIPRTLALMREAVQLADCSLIFDNSSYENPYRPIARREAGDIKVFVEPIPDWAAQILSLSTR